MPAILVPVDGSVHALKALHVACDLSEKYGGKLMLLNALVPGRKVGQILDLPIASKLPHHVIEQLRKAAARQRRGDAEGKGRADIDNSVPVEVLLAVGERILQDAAQRAQRRGIAAELLQSDDGDPVDAILQAAEQVEAHTIVMGCRGLSDEEAKAFGSVSQRVFQLAECTCISVK